MKRMFELKFIETVEHVLRVEAESFGDAEKFGSEMHSPNAKMVSITAVDEDDDGDDATAPPVELVKPPKKRGRKPRVVAGSPAKAKLAERNCEACKRPYMPKRADGRYCSRPECVKARNRQYAKDHYAKTHEGKPADPSGQ